MEMALNHHKFNDPDSPMPSLVEADEELWTECVGDCLANWMQNNQEFFTKQQTKMKTVALEPFLFAVKTFLSQAWIDLLVNGGVLTSDRLSSLDAFTEDEHYMLGLAELMFDRCALLVNNKNDIKTILNFIHDVEERQKTLEGIVDIGYAEKEVSDLQIFKSLWAPIRRMYDKKRSQAKICVIYFFKIMHSQIVAYGREGIDKIDYCKDRFLRKQARLEGTYDSFNKSAGDAYKSGDYKEAMMHYTQAVWRNPFNVACFGNRAQTYLNQKEYWNALWDCKRALIRDPKNCKNCYRQARACMELGWLEEAAEMNEKALKNCVPELMRVEIAKQKRLIEAHVKKRRDCESESAVNTKTQPVYNCQDSINLLSMVGDGCSLYDKGQYRASIEVWAKALAVFQDLGLQRLQMTEDDLTVLKFLHALTLVKTGIFNNLMSALDKLTTLESKSSQLVAVRYGFALVYFKLNRFNEARQQSTKGLKALEKKKMAIIPDCSWLNGCEMAEELSKEEMKKNLQHIFEKSSHPPKPDAVCRFHQDAQNPRLEIYLTDPDFKGLVRIRCSQKCCVEFHLSCWKTMKTIKHDNRIDKLMLDNPCPTPDCWGLIYSLQVYKSDSENPVEMVSNLKPSSNKKPRRPVIKMKTDNPEKLLKKEEKKQARKQRKQEQRNEMEGEENEDMEEDSKRKPSQIENVMKPTLYKGKTTLLVKDDSDEILKSQGKAKSSKSKKKKEKELTPKQTVLPLDVKFKDEGRQLFGAEDFVEADMMNVSGLLPMPGTAPLPLGNGILTIPTSIPYPPDELANTLFELFEDILRAHGPQFLGSPFLQDIMKGFPEEAHKKIFAYGGLYNFIYSNKKFDVIAGQILCVKEDSQKAQAMADVHFNMPRNGAFPGWPPAMLLGMMAPRQNPPPPPPFPPPPPSKPAFSWEQRARDMAAKLSGSSQQSQSLSSSSVVTAGKQQQNVKSTIVASNELPSLQEALSATSSSSSKRSRKTSSSLEKSHESIGSNTGLISTSTTTNNINNKDMDDDDGFILISRGGGKKHTNATSGTSSKNDQVNNDDMKIKDFSSPINTLSPKVNGPPGFMNYNGLDNISLSGTDGSTAGVGGLMGNSSLCSSMERQNIVSETSKNKLKNKIGGIADLDNFDLSATPSSNNSQKSSSSSSSFKFSSSNLEVEKKVFDNDGNNNTAGKVKFSNQAGDVKDDSKASPVNLGRGKLKVGGGGGMELLLDKSQKDNENKYNNDINDVDDDEDDALSVMDSVDDIDDYQKADDLNSSDRRQLLLRLNGMGASVELLKRQQEKSSGEKIPVIKKASQPALPQKQQTEILSNLSALLGGGSGRGIKSQPHQRRDSGTSSPLSLNDEGGDLAALRSDSPALSQGSSESSNQSQPPPLKPLKGIGGGLGILSRNKKGKQPLTTAPNIKPENSDSGINSSVKHSSKTSDLEADLNNFIYQTSSLPPPSPKPTMAAKDDDISNSSSSSSIGGGFSGRDGSGKSGTGLGSNFEMPAHHNWDESHDSKSTIDETPIDPVVLAVFRQFNNPDSTSLSSLLSSPLSIPDSSMNLSLTEPLENNFSSGRNKQLGLASVTSSSLFQNVDKNSHVMSPLCSSSMSTSTGERGTQGMTIPSGGKRLMNLQHNAEGFVTNGAGNMVSSPPIDFLNNEAAIKKLWWSSSGNGDNHIKTKSTSPTTSPSHFLRSQFGLSSSSTPVTSSSESKSLPLPWQPSISLTSTASSSRSLSSVINTTSPTSFPFNSIFKINENQTSQTPFGTEVVSQSNTVNPLSSSSVTKGESRNSVSPHQYQYHYDKNEATASLLSSSKSNGLLPKPTHLLQNPTGNSQKPLLPNPNNAATLFPVTAPGFDLNSDVATYTPKLNSNHTLFSQGFLATTSCHSNHPTDSVSDSVKGHSPPTAISSSYFNPSAAPFIPSTSAVNSVNTVIPPSLNNLTKDCLLPNPVRPNTVSSSKNWSSENLEDFAEESRSAPSFSSSSLLQFNPNSREFVPTSHYQPPFALKSMKTAMPILPDSPPVAVSDTSCQTDKVEAEVTSVMMNTDITCEMFEEMLDFIKQEAKRCQDLKEELDREKARLKQAQAAECVLKRNLEESQGFLDTEKSKNEEMQEKLNVLRDEMGNLERKNVELQRKNSVVAAKADLMEKEKSRAVTAEKKILQISSQLMGQRLDGKKTEAAKHMTQLQNACLSFTSKGVPVPQAITTKQKEWQEFVTKCDQQLDSLQDFFNQQIDHLNKGKLLKDLPEVSSKVTVPEMPKPPSSLDITAPATERVQESDPPMMSDARLGAKGDNSVNYKSVNPPPGLKPLSKPLPAPLQPRQLQQQGGIGMTGIGGNKFLQKLSQQLPQSSLPSSLSSVSASFASNQHHHHQQQQQQQQHQFQQQQQQYQQQQQQQQQAQTPFDRIVVELQNSFPILSRETISSYLEVVRCNNGGSLSKMPASQVVAAIKALLLGNASSTTSTSSNSFNMEDLPIIMRGGSTKEGGGLGSGGGRGAEEEDNVCPICHEDMIVSQTRVLDCSHVFHEECIRRWFQQQRSCPNCRVFSLLSDDFPSLK